VAHTLLLHWLVLHVCISGFPHYRCRYGQIVPQVAVLTFAVILNDVCIISSGSEPDP